MASFQAMRFMQQLQSYLRAISEYEDPNWQREALQRIPKAALEERANKALAEQTESSARLSFRDELLKALLHWFKHEFFKWTNQPPCSRCQSPTTAIGATAPNAEESRWRAGVVELYRCNVCASVTRFPRYNHPIKLLDTRAGRCGEWAQCFTLCCRAMQFEVRAVHDWTDHVWSEVYSNSQQRWIHCDSCEDCMDRPDLYETGWGKKLNYVIAVSKDEVVDVTRRYTKKYAEVKTRRTLCDEATLQVMISIMNLQKWNVQTKERKAELLARAAVEQRELQGAAQVDHRLGTGELAGRTTGSAEWRRARGEMGDEVKTQHAIAQQEKTKQQIQQSTTTETQKSAASIPSSATASSATAPPTSTMASCSSSPSSVASTDAKEQVTLLFSRYHNQLTNGCGKMNCANEFCKSSARFIPPTDSSARAIASRCLELTTQYKASKLCDNVNR